MIITRHQMGRLCFLRSFLRQRILRATVFGSHFIAFFNIWYIMQSIPSIIQVKVEQNQTLGILGKKLIILEQLSMLCVFTSNWNFLELGLWFLVFSINLFIFVNFNSLQDNL